MSKKAPPLGNLNRAAEVTEQQTNKPLKEMVFVAPSAEGTALRDKHYPGQPNVGSAASQAPPVAFPKTPPDTTLNAAGLSGRQRYEEQRPIPQYIERSASRPETPVDQAQLMDTLNNYDPSVLTPLEINGTTASEGASLALPDPQQANPFNAPEVRPDYFKQVQGQQYQSVFSEPLSYSSGPTQSMIDTTSQYNQLREFSRAIQPYQLPAIQFTPQELDPSTTGGLQATAETKGPLSWLMGDATEDFNPLKGEWGASGTGIVGGAGWLLGRTFGIAQTAVVGAALDVSRSTAAIVEGVSAGVSTGSWDAAVNAASQNYYSNAPSVRGVPTNSIFGNKDWGDAVNSGYFTAAMVGTADYSLGGAGNRGAGRDVLIDKTFNPLGFRDPFRQFNTGKLEEYERKHNINPATGKKDPFGGANWTHGYDQYLKGAAGIVADVVLGGRLDKAVTSIIGKDVIKQASKLPTGSVNINGGKAAARPVQLTPPVPAGALARRTPGMRGVGPGDSSALSVRAPGMAGEYTSGGSSRVPGGPIVLVKPQRIYPRPVYDTPRLPVSDPRALPQGADPFTPPKSHVYRPAPIDIDMSAGGAIVVYSRTNPDAQKLVSAGSTASLALPPASSPIIPRIRNPRMAVPDAPGLTLKASLDTNADDLILRDVKLVGKKLDPAETYRVRTYDGGHVEVLKDNQVIAQAKGTIPDWAEYKPKSYYRSVTNADGITYYSKNNSILYKEASPENLAKQLSVKTTYDDVSRTFIATGDNTNVVDFITNAAEGVTLQQVKRTVPKKTTVLKPVTAELVPQNAPNIRVVSQLQPSTVSPTSIVNPATGIITEAAEQERLLRIAARADKAMRGVSQAQEGASTIQRVETLAPSVPVPPSQVYVRAEALSPSLSSADIVRRLASSETIPGAVYNPRLMERGERSLQSLISLGRNITLPGGVKIIGDDVNTNSISNFGRLSKRVEAAIVSAGLNPSDAEVGALRSLFNKRGVPLPDNLAPDFAIEVAPRTLRSPTQLVQPAISKPTSEWTDEALNFTSRYDLSEDYAIAIKVNVDSKTGKLIPLHGGEMKLMPPVRTEKIDVPLTKSDIRELPTADRVAAVRASAASGQVVPPQAITDVVDPVIGTDVVATRQYIKTELPPEAKPLKSTPEVQRAITQRASLHAELDDINNQLTDTSTQLTDVEVVLDDMLRKVDELPDVGVDTLLDDVPVPVSKVAPRETMGAPTVVGDVARVDVDIADTRPWFHGTRVDGLDISTVNPIHGAARSEVGTAFWLTRKEDVAISASGRATPANVPPLNGRSFGDKSLVHQVEQLDLDGLRIVDSTYTVDDLSLSFMFEDISLQLGDSYDYTDELLDALNKKVTADGMTIPQLFNSVDDAVHNVALNATGKRASEAELLNVQRVVTQVLADDGIDGVRLGDSNVALYRLPEDLTPSTIHDVTDIAGDATDDVTTALHNVNLLESALTDSPTSTTLKVQLAEAKAVAASRIRDRLAREQDELYDEQARVATALVEQDEQLTKIRQAQLPEARQSQQLQEDKTLKAFKNELDKPFTGPCL